jgi:hypothetical protein
MPDLPLAIERNGSRWWLRGTIDERAHLADLAADVAAAGVLCLDLEGITHINSIGVRDWSSLLRRLADRGIDVRLERCAEVMVQQMNMIEDARGKAGVDSIMAPFGCDACGWEGHRVLVIPEIVSTVASGRPPPATCAECGEVARFTDFVDRYFLFLEAP